MLIQEQGLGWGFKITSKLSYFLPSPPCLKVRTWGSFSTSLWPPLNFLFSTRPREMSEVGDSSPAAQSRGNRGGQERRRTQRRAKDLPLPAYSPIPSTQMQIHDVSTFYTSDNSSFCLPSASSAKPVRLSPSHPVNQQPPADAPSALPPASPSSSGLLVCSLPLPFLNPFLTLHPV